MSSIKLSLSSNSSIQLGSLISFKRDNFSFVHDGLKFFKWKKGEQCKVLGLVKNDDVVNLLLGTGDDFFEYEEIPISDVDQILNIDRSSFFDDLTEQEYALIDVSEPDAALQSASHIRLLG